MVCHDWTRFENNIIGSWTLLKSGTIFLTADESRWRYQMQVLRFNFFWCVRFVGLIVSTSRLAVFTTPPPPHSNHPSHHKWEPGWWQRQLESKLAYRKILLSLLCKPLSAEYPLVVKCSCGSKKGYPTGNAQLAVWKYQFCLPGNYYRVTPSEGQDPGRPSTKTGTQDNRFPPFFLNHDSYVTGDFTISRWWLWF